MNLSDRDQSEFNSAVATLNRINFYLELSNQAKLQRNSYDWLNCLHVLYIEISSSMKVEERKTKMEELKTLFMFVEKQVVVGDRMKKKIIDKNLFWQMTSYEQELRQIATDSGLLIKIKDDPRFSLK